MRSPILAVLLLSALAVGVRADPTVTNSETGAGTAVWTFGNPADYTVANVTLSGAGASLAWGAGTVGDTTQSDFAAASLLDNVDVTTAPGDVAILNLTGTGPPTVQTYQPGPAQVDDTYIWSGGGGNTNFWAAATLNVGYWGNNEWNRALLRFPTVLLPANATLVRAALRLYMYTAATPAPMEISAHAITTDWMESLATWQDYDGSNSWNVTGGDFDPFVVDAVPGITTTVGWYEWNVTSLARGWWNGTIPNYGLLLRQINDDARVTLGRKQFYSSDIANASARPKVIVTYTLPGSLPGIVESRVLDAGGIAEWSAASWSATIPNGAAVTVQVRTGNIAPIDGTWSPWSSLYAAPGALSDAPPGRYLQYRLSMTAGTGSPVVRDVSFTYQRFPVQGVLRTQEFRPPTLGTWGVLNADVTTPSETRVDLEFSTDAGTSWTHASIGQSLNAVPPRALVLRVTLSTNDTRSTPWIHDLTLGFTVAADGGGIWSGPAVFGVPVWILLIPFAILAAWSLTREVRHWPFDATDLFLIHRDGRLIHRAGGTGGPVKDEDAVSGMFTVVAEFVKDAFGGADGEGDLKHFKVDTREVAVARYDYLFLALVGKGALPPSLNRNMTWFLRGVSATHRANLKDWDGLVENIGDVPHSLDWFLARGPFRRFLWPRGQFRCG